MQILYKHKTKYIYNIYRHEYRVDSRYIIIYNSSHLRSACRELYTTMSVLLSRQVQADVCYIITSWSVSTPSHNQLAAMTLGRGEREANKLPTHQAVSRGGFEVEIKVGFPRAYIRFEGSTQPTEQLLSRVGL